MAAGRERRGNAGSKMAKLLNEEEEDDFYKTTYGGFEEVEDDKVGIVFSYCKRNFFVLCAKMSGLVYTSR